MANEIAGAGTAVVGGGAAGGGAGDGGGEGGGVATEVDPNAGGSEGGEEGGAEGDGGEGDGEAGTGEGEGEGAGEGDGEDGAEAEGDGSEFETDGRKIDDATKKALAALKKVDPAAAKRVAEAYFELNNGFKKVFKTVHEARGAKATIDSLGGQEGIQEIQSEVSDYRNEIAQFAKGDVALINNLWEANPEGLELSAAASIEFLGQKNAEAFDRVVVPAMVARLEKAGFFTGMTELAEHIKAGDGQKAYDLLQKIGKFFGDAKAMQKKQLELKSRVDPDRQKLEQDRADFEKKKSVEFENRIAANANQLNNRAMSKIVEPFFKDMKLPTEGRRRFVQGLQAEIWSAMKADKAFQVQARTIQKQGDEAETAQFISEKFSELLPGIFQKYRNEVYPNYSRLKTVKPKVGGGNGAAATGGGAGAGATIKVALGARPRHEDVSWASDGGKTTDIDWIRGIAYLKNGKKHVFDKSAPPNRM